MSVLRRARRQQNRALGGRRVVSWCVCAASVAEPASPILLSVSGIRWDPAANPAEVGISDASDPTPIAQRQDPVATTTAADVSSFRRRTTREGLTRPRAIRRCAPGTTTMARRRRRPPFEIAARRFEGPTRKKSPKPTRIRARTATSQSRIIETPRVTHVKRSRPREATAGLSFFQASDDLPTLFAPPDLRRTPINLWTNTPSEDCCCLRLRLCGV